MFEFDAQCVENSRHALSTMVGKPAGFAHSFKSILITPII